LQNLSREEWDKQQIEQTTVPVVLKRELKVTVSDDEAKKFYDENTPKFEQPEMVRASHVLFGTLDSATNAELPADKKAAKRKLAEDVLKRARAGEDFAKLAKEYSDDPGSKDTGGEYTFPRGKMVPEFETAAFSMQTNQISDIITTQFGYHIIKLSEKIPAKKMELAKVSSDIKDYLAQQQLQEKIPDFITKLKADANLEILDPKLKLKEFPAGTNPPGARALPTPTPKPGAKPSAQ
jgi:peptidyl-prolyl cis-trans isomerase C